MPRLFLRVLFMTLLAAVLAACGTRARRPVDPAKVFEIRAVGVTANGNVPAGVIAGIKARIEQSIEATASPMPRTPAVINVHIVSVQRDNAGHAQTELSVTVSEVTSAQPVLVRSYVILAFAERGRVKDAAIADAVASRIRYEYGLSTPAIKPVLRHDPALSTRIKPANGIEADDNQIKPIVIPLKTAPVLGADQDPMLNSKTKVEPVKEPVKVEPAVKAKSETDVETPKKAAPAPAESTVETGAKAKVVIKPRATDTAPADEEPCVETLDNKC